MKTVPLNQKTF